MRGEPAGGCGCGCAGKGAPGAEGPPPGCPAQTCHLPAQAARLLSRCSLAPPQTNHPHPPAHPCPCRATRHDGRLEIMGPSWWRLTVRAAIDFLFLSGLSQCLPAATHSLPPLLPATTSCPSTVPDHRARRPHQPGWNPAPGCQARQLPGAAAGWQAPVLGPGRRPPLLAAPAAPAALDRMCAPPCSPPSPLPLQRQVKLAAAGAGPDGCKLHAFTVLFGDGGCGHRLDQPW